ncbi:hypothetical protein GCM10007108_10370 [Thermogymnomonas acidicola]|uniref:Uncharacterized protein n=1 Tax=Thermogymnomonas acidicola TaxID=399579 RepID=A0AA37BRG9_9ARCH|nr:hypothetical protein [Thermogymnomonas acidicola]GGM74367.1 hypothetical protein GCM10007108_10370 [Thermogymnomonas acidicola]
MEVVDISSLEKLFRDHIKGFFEERMDNVVVGVGRTALDVIRRIVPIEMRRVSYYALLEDRHEAPDPEGVLEVSSASQAEVKVLSEGSLSVLGEQVLGQKNAVDVEVLIVPSEAAEERVRMVPYLERMGRSLSFLIFADLSDEFARKSMVTLSDLMSARKIPHLCVALKPPRESRNLRAAAEWAIGTLEGSGRFLRTYERHLPRALSERRKAEERLLELMAREVETLSMKITSAVEISKYEIMVLATR